jgi:hypothetical protein
VIGCLPITAVCAPISSFCTLWSLTIRMIGGLLLMIGDLPIEFLAYLCGLWPFWEADRRDRPVRGLSGLFLLDEYCQVHAHNSLILP